MLILVYGAGGHGKVVADILLSRGDCAIDGFIDDDPSSHGSTVNGIPVIGGAETMEPELQKGRVAVVLAIGSNVRRKQIAEKCAEWGAELLTAIHPTATVSQSARIGPGTVVMAGAIVNPSAEVGAGVIVNSGAVIEHDVIVGDYAHVSPNAAMGGGSRLGALSHLGLGAIVLPGVAIGQRSVIGAGAVVTRQMADDIVAVGVPAQIKQKD
jgi:sugar O-acyltransferase (sialic acid O-acetyltransferase NeuD family)